MKNKKRDLIEEVQAIKGRSKYSAFYTYHEKMSAIEGVLRQINTSKNTYYNNELLKYIPIATVACFEAFFRSAIQVLVDSDKNFKDNIIKFNQANNIKLDFAILANIEAKTITVGELVSHILSFNNYEDINSNLSKLLNKDFTKELKSFNKKSHFDHANTERQLFQEKFVEILASVKRTYELRHIFCHELGTKVIIDKKEIIENFVHCKLFLEQSNSLISEMLYPNAPETQTEMNIYAGKRFFEKEKKLIDLIAKIKELAPNEEFRSINLELFDKALDKWKKYRELYADSKTIYEKGGSIHSLLYSSEKTTVTENYIAFLKEDFKYLLEK